MVKTNDTELPVGNLIAYISKTTLDADDFEEKVKANLWDVNRGVQRTYKDFDKFIGFVRRNKNQKVRVQGEQAKDKQWWMICPQLFDDDIMVDENPTAKRFAKKVIEL